MGETLQVPSAKNKPAPATPHAVDVSAFARKGVHSHKKQRKPLNGPCKVVCLKVCSIECCTGVILETMFNMVFVSSAKNVGGGRAFQIMSISSELNVQGAEALT